MQAPYPTWIPLQAMFSSSILIGSRSCHTPVETVLAGPTTKPLKIQVLSCYLRKGGRITPPGLGSHFFWPPLSSLARGEVWTAAQSEERVPVAPKPPPPTPKELQISPLVARRPAMASCQWPGSYQSPDGWRHEPSEPISTGSATDLAFITHQDICWCPLGALCLCYSEGYFYSWVAGSGEVRRRWGWTEGKSSRDLSWGRGLFLR